MSDAPDKAASGTPSGHFAADAVKITAEGSELDIQTLESGPVKPEKKPKARKLKAEEPKPETEMSPGTDSRLDDFPAAPEREPELEVKPEPASEVVRASGMTLGKSVVVNAPTAQNNGGFETKVVPPAHASADKTSGANATMAANAYEQRVTQEQGTH